MFVASCVLRQCHQHPEKCDVLGVHVLFLFGFMEVATEPPMDPLNQL